MLDLTINTTCSNTNLLFIDLFTGPRFLILSVYDFSYNAKTALSKFAAHLVLLFDHFFIFNAGVWNWRRVPGTVGMTSTARRGPLSTWCSHSRSALCPAMHTTNMVVILRLSRTRILHKIKSFLQVMIFNNTCSWYKKKKCLLNTGCLNRTKVTF